MVSTSLNRIRSNLANSWSPRNLPVSRMQRTNPGHLRAQVTDGVSRLLTENDNATSAPVALPFVIIAVTECPSGLCKRPSAIIGTVLIRIEGSDLPGSFCGPGPDYPDGHHNVHVAVQGRKGQQDLFGLVPADVKSVLWELEGSVSSTSPTVDLRGPQIQGRPGKRFIYLTW
jgi:hypothetical protein